MIWAMIGRSISSRRERIGWRHAALILFAAGLLIASPARADVRKGGGEVGFDVGSTQFDSSFSDSPGARVVLRAGYFASNLFEIEGQLGVANRSDVTIYTGFVDGVFNFRPGDRLTAYFLLGVGGANVDLDSADDTGLAGQLAGGFRAWGEEGRIGLRLELGVMVLDTFDETSTSLNGTVGLTFDLGKQHNHRQPRKVPKNNGSQVGW